MSLLSDEEIINTCDKVFFHAATAIEFARAIESAIPSKPAPLRWSKS